MKVMKSIFILLAVLGLNLSVLAQQNNQGDISKPIKL